MKNTIKLFLYLTLFMVIIMSACRKDESIKQKTNLEIKKQILTSRIWYLSNKLCPDEGFHFNFTRDSVTQTKYQTFDYNTWYNSSNKGAYILTDDSIKFNRVFYYFGDNILPYSLTEDSLIIYPTSTSYIKDKFIWVSKPIYGKP